jgi:predicted ATPase
MSLIKVIEWNGKTISKNAIDASFYLERDNWNDFDYYTTYHLHISSKHSNDGQPIYVGPTKILKKNQKEFQQFLIPLGPKNNLDSSFISLGLSLDYYQRIASLGQDLAKKILLALKDAVYNQKRIEGFQNDEGWAVSLMRDFSTDNDIFKIAPNIIEGNFDTLLDIDLKFSFDMPGLDQAVEFNFDSPKYGQNNISLPNRISVIIGRNGSGKSTILSRISRIAFASSKDRSDADLSKVGSVSPIGLGFPKIINISYSAFDSFQVPGIYKQEKHQIAKEIKTGQGRYIFCGLRDIVKELDESLSTSKTDSSGKLNSEAILKERNDKTYLKSIADLSADFIYQISVIKNSKNDNLFYKCIEVLYKEPSMHFLKELDFLEMSNGELYNTFFELSTGHKFILHSISSILSYIEPRTLILFDEPETHLHPPVLAALMNAIRIILSHKNSFMITATHSPVILQETLKSNVNIIRREGNLTKFSKPDIQTFGENIGLITSAVFGLSAEMSDYHRTLDKLVKRFKYDFDDLPNEEIFNKIEALFEGGLSMQARAYIMSKVFLSRN